MQTRVLIVDDMPSSRRAAIDLLERHGYSIAGEADSAAAAVAAVEQLEPDAVLLEVCLPDQNGFQVAARMTQARPTLAVLLTSASFDDDYFELAHKSGARGFVHKSLLPQTELTRYWPSADCGS